MLASTVLSCNVRRTVYPRKSAVDPGYGFGVQHSGLSLDREVEKRDEQSELISTPHIHFRPTLMFPCIVSSFSLTRDQIFQSVPASDVSRPRLSRYLDQVSGSSLLIRLYAWIFRPSVKVTRRRGRNIPHLPESGVVTDLGALC